MQRFIKVIRNKHDLKNLIVFLNQFKLGKPVQVEFKLYKQNRSIEQNKLMWLWHKEEGEHDGETKDYCHERFKYKYVLPILLRNDEKGRLAKLVDQAKRDKEMMAALVKIISTTHLTTSELKEALDEYNFEASLRGLMFTQPDAELLS